MPEPKEIGHQVKFSNTLVGLFKKGCWEIPEIMGSTVMALVGIGMAFYGLQKYYAEDGDNKEYKMTYVVVRADDPQAKKLKNPVKTEFNKCT